MALDPTHATELYRGPFLDGLSLPDNPDFEIWMTTERERFAQLHVSALTALVQARRAAGDWQTMIELARRALESDHVQEPMHRALMEAHARLGARAEALRQYDVLRTTLQRELGVEPLPETEALRQQILDGTFADAAPRVPIRVAKRPPILGDAPRAPYWIKNSSARSVARCASYCFRAKSALANPVCGKNGRAVFPLI